MSSGSCHFSRSNTKVATTSPIKDCRREKQRKRSGLLSPGSCQFPRSNTKVPITSPIKDCRREKKKKKKKKNAVGFYRQVHVIFPVPTPVPTTSPIMDCRQEKRKRSGLLSPGSCQFSRSNTRVPTTSPTKDCRREKTKTQWACIARFMSIFLFQHQSGYNSTHYHTKTKDALDLQQA